MRILVVDDDLLAAELTAAVLEEGGCDVITVESAAEALQVLTGDPAFDAVVSDMNMPGMSGLEFFRALRARGEPMPFILLSGDDPRSLKRQEPGLTACIAKDMDLETTLVTAVADALLPSDE